jgi:hypothetical protein
VTTHPGDAVTTIDYDMDPSYQAGACNIGPAEIRRRRQAGVMGVAAAVILAAVLVAIDAPSAARWLVALPLTGGIVGFAQAHFRFCAAYGLMGLRNFGALGSQERIEAEAIAADRRRALAIGVGSTGLALVLTGLFVSLPI